MFADFNNNQNNDDFLDEFRQKLNSESNETFEERKKEISRSKNVFVGTTAGIVLSAIVGWFVLAPRYADNNTADIPVIRRPQTAIKVQPADPGGEEIQNQDKSVYNIIDKQKPLEANVEKLLPSPEEPKLPMISTNTDTIQKAEEIIQNTETAQAVNETPAPAPATATATTPPSPEILPQNVSEAPKDVVENIITAQPASVVVKETFPSTEENVQVTEKAKPDVSIKIDATKETKSPETKKTVTIKGPWQVQLISSPNRSAVDTAWTGLVKKYPMLEGQPREIETADLGSKGTFYRLKAGGFADRNGADRLCNDIKALGGTCIVKKK